MTTAAPYFSEPQHFPMPVNADGDGPQCEADQVSSVICWCASDGCGLWKNMPEFASGEFPAGEDAVDQLIREEAAR